MAYTADDLIAKYRTKPWVAGAENEQNWRTYLNDPVKGLNGQNDAYWEQRIADAPGTGSNAAPAARTPYTSRRKSAMTLDPYGMPVTPSPAPESSDLMSQVMEELDAQQNGGVSPVTRQTHLNLLRGSR